MANLLGSKGEVTDSEYEAITPVTLPEFLDLHGSKDSEMQALSSASDLTQPELPKPRSRLRLFAVLTGLNVSVLKVQLL